MYGWRAMIGLIVPSSNTTMECELNDALPPGISLHTARAMQVLETEEELFQMAKHAERAAQELASAEVDVILYGCTSGSFLKGESWNQAFTQKLSRIVERPVVTTATAVLEALEILSIKEVSLVTPYPKETNKKAVIWLETAGVKVVETIELIVSTYDNPISNLQIAKLSPERIYSRVRRDIQFPSSAILISCTNLQTFKIIETLEKDLKRPVVTSNQASLYAVMRRLELASAIQGYGTLLDHDPTQGVSRQ